MRQRIPTFRLPLRGHEEPEVDLRAMLDVVYDTGGYGESIDYRTEPVPPLDEDDATWARTLAERGGAR